MQTLEATLPGSAELVCFRVDDHASTQAGSPESMQDTRAVAALSIADDEAERLVHAHFPNLGDGGLRYSHLANSEANQDALLALLRDLLSHFKSATCLYDRRYLLALTFVDYAIAPFYRERGMSVYAKGENAAMASLLSLNGSALLGGRAFDNLLRAFQNSVEQKTAEAKRQLIAAARATEWHRLPEALGPLAQFAAPECLDAIAHPQAKVDPTGTVLDALLNRLESLADGPYCIELPETPRTSAHVEILQKLAKRHALAEPDGASLRQEDRRSGLAAVRKVDAQGSVAHQLVGILARAALDACEAPPQATARGRDASSMRELFAGDTVMRLMPRVHVDEKRLSA